MVHHEWFTMNGRYELVTIGSSMKSMILPKRLLSFILGTGGIYIDKNKNLFTNLLSTQR